MLPHYGIQTTHSPLSTTCLPSPPTLPPRPLSLQHCSLLLGSTWGLSRHYHSLPTSSKTLLLLHVISFTFPPTIGLSWQYLYATSYVTLENTNSALDLVGISKSHFYSGKARYLKYALIVLFVIELAFSVVSYQIVDRIFRFPYIMDYKYMIPSSKLFSNYCKGCNIKMEWNIKTVICLCVILGISIQKNQPNQFSFFMWLTNKQTQRQNNLFILVWW